MHGFIRGVATLGVRRGDLHARLIADPDVAANPVAYYDELRAAGPLVKGRVSYLTADHALPEAAGEPVDIADLHPLGHDPVTAGEHHGLDGAVAILDVDGPVLLVLAARRRPGAVRGAVDGQAGRFARRGLGLAAPREADAGDHEEDNRE
ncbi:hypothetical protein A5679_12665 [Mycobacterium scrofulaceum]|uniref:Uncharacterized protein n=1 Tax=Mycobacterium scrofulaceum TaxID=1783 RepID=A0A1A2VZN7_MYCSC|nr:hypothetical protein A5679_12665 [Mycobacterium scrofulaceum]